MRDTRTFSLLLAPLLLASIGLAQTGDWRAVQHLPGGTMLKIKLKHGHTFGHCDFMGATATRCTAIIRGCSTFERDIRATILKRCTRSTMLEPSGLESERSGNDYGCRHHSRHRRRQVSSLRLSTPVSWVDWAISSAWWRTRSFMAKPSISAPMRRKASRILLPKISKTRAIQRAIYHALRMARPCSASTP